MDTKKNLLTILVAVVVLSLIVIGYFYYQKPKLLPKTSVSVEEKAAESTEKVLESVTNVALPEIGPVNPLEKLPEVNPLDKTNPFKDLYKNPFAR